MRPEPRLPREDINYTKTHPLREAIVLSTGLITAGLVFFAVFAFFVDRIIPMIPISWEEKIFAGFSIVPNKPTLVRDQKAAQLEDLLSRMASHWPENPYNLRVKVILSEQTNAFAVPGGEILITSGLLEKVESQNELAFVLGHEIGHFRNRDHLRSLGRGVSLGLLMAVIQGGGGSAPELIQLGGNLSARKFNRSQERAADAFALALLHQEYGHVSRAWDFFKRLPTPQSEIERNISSYLSTHPMSKDRVENLKTRAREKGWATEGESVPLWK